MATLRNVDLGTVDEVRANPIRVFTSVESFGNPGVYQQNSEIDTHSMTIAGFISSPTQAQMEALKTLRDGEVALLNLSTEYGYHQWVKVTSTSFAFKGGEPGVFNYMIQCKPVPCVGYVRALTAEMAFSDNSYARLVRRYNPYSGRHNVTHASLLTHQHELFLINLKSTEQTLEFEMDCGDDVCDVEVWGWKAAAWSVVGHWASGEVEFGATAVWTDEDADEHTFRVNHGIVGASLANFTKALTQALGTDRRVGIQVTGMDAYSASPVMTKYGDYQLKLKVLLTHTSRESGRPYTIVTMRDGGYGLGPA